MWLCLFELDGEGGGVIGDVLFPTVMGRQSWQVLVLYEYF